MTFNATTLTVRSESKGVFALLFYAIGAAILLLIFYENFLFGSQLGKISLHSVDDLAFQLVLRSVHVAIDHGEFSKLWTINAYAYGWIYWAPLALITYPLYLVSSHFGLDWPLIVLPRQISLLFTFGGAFFLRRIVKRFTADETTCAAAVAVYLLNPTIGYFSMRFGTVTAISFFSILSVYLVLRSDKPSFRQLAPSVLALATAGGIKLSGLLIAPFVFIVIVRRAIGMPARKALGLLCALGVLFIVSLAILTNPAFLAIPANPEILTQYLDTLRQIMNGTQVGRSNITPMQRFYDAAFGSKINAIGNAFLALGLLINFRAAPSRRLVYFATISTLIVVVLYLMLMVKAEQSAGSYFTAVSFLLIIGLLGWQRFTFGIAATFFIVLFFVGDAVQRIENQHKNGSYSLNHASYLIRNIQSKPSQERADFIEQCIAANGGKQPIEHMFYDYELTPPFNSLTMPNTCFSVIWGNLSPENTYCSKPVQYILLNLKAPGFSDQDTFDRQLTGMASSLVDRARLDRENRIALVEHGIFAKQRFSRVCDGQDVAVFKADH